MKITIKKIGDVAIPAHDSDKELWQRFSDAEYVIDIKNLDTRTVAQNAALHKWCEQIAYTLNKEGLKMTGLFNNDIDWTMLLVKEQIVKSILKKTLNINSTTKLMKKDIDGLVMYLTKAFGERFGVQMPPFPSRELFE